MTLDSIPQNLREGIYSNDPHGASHALAVLSGEFSWKCAQLEEILAVKPAVWNQLRVDQKSDTATERVWESTESGIKEMRLKLQIKSIEKMMSSLRTLINLAEKQYRSSNYPTA